MEQEKMKNHYIDFGVTPYALADVCEALFNHGVTNGFLTKEDGDIHVRWEYNITRDKPVKKEVGDYNSNGIIQRLEKQSKNKPTECEDKVYPHSVDHNPVADAYSRGRNNGIQLVLDNPEEYDLQKSTEWSKEDTDFKTESVRYLCNLRDTFEKK